MVATIRVGTFDIKSGHLTLSRVIEDVRSDEMSFSIAPNTDCVSVCGSCSAAAPEYSKRIPLFALSLVWPLPVARIR